MNLLRRREKQNLFAPRGFHGSKRHFPKGLCKLVYQCSGTPKENQVIVAGSNAETLALGELQLEENWWEDSD